MKISQRPTIGLALSGSGNRSTFYVGFLERLSEANIPIDYISAMSGGSLVAAAYATGKLEEFKNLAMELNAETIKKYFIKSEKGGLYSMQYLENFLRELYGGLIFEEVRPRMAFVAADIETGEQVVLCLGDIARAACISCTLPGVFEPVKWGGRTLVDGGLLNQIPLDVLKDWNADITIAINTRGTKHIFTEGQITFKRILNYIKKYLFIDAITSWVGSLVREDGEYDFAMKPGIFAVLGKSLDIAVKASAEQKPELQPDVLISPNMEKNLPTDFNENTMRFYYEQGRRVADEYIPQIKKMITDKQKIQELA